MSKNNFTYTSGPWDVEGHSDYYGVYQLNILWRKYYELDNSLPVQTDIESDEYDRRLAELDKEAEGNRRLIEAAPAMWELVNLVREARGPFVNIAEDIYFKVTKCAE